MADMPMFSGNANMMNVAGMQSQKSSFIYEARLYKAVQRADETALAMKNAVLTNEPFSFDELLMFAEAYVYILQQRYDICWHISHHGLDQQLAPPIQQQIQNNYVVQFSSEINVIVNDVTFLLNLYLMPGRQGDVEYFCLCLKIRAEALSIKLAISFGDEWQTLNDQIQSDYLLALDICAEQLYPSHSLAISIGYSWCKYQTNVLGNASAAFGMARSLLYRANHEFFMAAIAPDPFCYQMLEEVQAKMEEWRNWASSNQIVVTNYHVDTTMCRMIT